LTLNKIKHFSKVSTIEDPLQLVEQNGNPALRGCREIQFPTACRSAAQIPLIGTARNEFK